jgi:hypothetical protein
MGRVEGRGGRSDDEIPSASCVSTIALGKRSYRRITGLRDGNRNNQRGAKIGTRVEKEEEMELELYAKQP